MKNDARPTETLISVAALRALCGAAPGEIEALIRSRALTVRSGKVSLVTGVRSYLDAIRATARSTSLAAAQDAARSARADAAELALAVDARRLVTIDDAHYAIAHLCGAINTAFTVMPARATRDPRLRRQIDALIFMVRSDIAAEIGRL